MKHRRTDDDGDYLSERVPPETRVTFSLWAIMSLIILLFIGFAVWSSNVISAHSERITKVETAFPYIVDKLEKIDQRLVQHMEEGKGK